MISEFEVDWLAVGEFGTRNYYHFGRLRSHGDINYYHSDKPFDVNLIKQSAYSYASRHGFHVETLFYRVSNTLAVARVIPPASVLGIPIVPKRPRPKTPAERRKKAARRERFASLADLCLRKRRKVKTSVPPALNMVA